MRKIVEFVIFLFFLFSLSERLNVFAQDPNDPGQPDTVYYVGAGLHSGYDLYVPPGPGPFDVKIDMCIWTDNDVQGVTFPCVDRCYNASTYPTFLAPTKNTDALLFTGTLLDNSGFIKSLNLAGTITPTPPHFNLGAANFAGEMFQETRGVLAHLTFTVTGVGCICLDTVFAYYPPPTGVTCLLVDTLANGYVPIVNAQCFNVMVDPSSCPTENEEGPSAFALLGNYPNPFNPATSIQFRVGSLEFREAVHTTLTIYNILGQRVITLLNEDKLPGEYKLVWDGKDDKGVPVGSGIYLYRLVAGDFSATKRMILIK
jgi:hypothetical protein